MNGAEREPEELRLRHEAQEAPRPERERRAPRGRDSRGGRRPGRSRPRRADARFRGPVAEDEAQHRPGNDGDQRSRAEMGLGGRVTGGEYRGSGPRRYGGARNGCNQGKRLVIVESPAKAKTIAGYLGPDYVVESSIGHIRDLPNNASEIPAKYKDEAWARLGVNVDNDFEPLYVVDSRKKKVVADLKAKLKNADELLLATDEDREGEAIAWHLRRGAEAEGPGAPHGLPRDHAAGDRARARARRATSTTSLVDAQETRRILDRLYGYEVSPVLWRKIMQGLSAGRVQSVATRLVVERERERMQFVAADVLGHRRDASTRASSPRGSRRSTAAGSRRAATSAATATLTTRRRGAARPRPTRAARRRRSTARRSPSRSVEEKPYTRRPAAPFMTSTLQQEASRKLRLSSQQTMRVAQRLYENGYITYMRTDSTTLSESALAAARDQARELYGADSVPDAPRQLQPQGEERAGGARGDPPGGRPLPHARRGARASSRRDEFNALRPDLEAHGRLADGGRARRRRSRCGIAATRADGRSAEFSTAGTVITFRGFLLAYEEGRDEPSRRRRGEACCRRSPRATRSTARALEPDGHSTSPPRALHRGEPRQGARGARHRPPVDLRRDHGHDPRPRLRAQAGAGARAGVPRVRGRRTCSSSTSRSSSTTSSPRAWRTTSTRSPSGDEARTAWLQRFYFGDDGDDGPEGARRGSPRRHRRARDQHGRAAGAATSSCASASTARTSSAATERQTLPPDIAPDELTAERAEEILAQGKPGARARRRPGERAARSPCAPAATARTSPRCVGGRREAAHRVALQDDVAGDGHARGGAAAADAAARRSGESDGEEVVAANGRYGPYVKRGKESRSLDSEEQLFTITLDEALAQARRAASSAAAAPPRRRSRSSATTPSAASRSSLKEGRFGPYVTDGETNASLRAADSVESITPERAAELLQDRRDRGPGAEAQAGAEEALVTSCNSPYNISGPKPSIIRVGRERNGAAAGARSERAVPWPREGLHEPVAETKGHRFRLDSEPAERTA